MLRISNWADGAAVAHWSSGTFTSTGCTFANNFGRYSSGAVFTYGTSRAEIRHSTLIGNTATWGRCLCPPQARALAAVEPWLCGDSRRFCRVELGIRRAAAGGLYAVVQWQNYAGVRHHTCVHETTQHAAGAEFGGLHDRQLLVCGHAPMHGRPLHRRRPLVVRTPTPNAALWCCQLPAMSMATHSSVFAVGHVGMHPLRSWTMSPSVTLAP